MPPTESRLLTLPSEIRLQIWKFAFGSSDIPLHGTTDAWSLACEECVVRPPLRCSSSNTTSLPHRDDKLPSAMEEYNKRIAIFRTHRTIFSEAFPIFLSSLTLHIDHPDMLKVLKQKGPKSLRQNTEKAIVYIHFTDYNYRTSYEQIYEITKTLPNLKHVRVNYHMRPPISYENLLDAAYLTVPILLLPPPLNRPLYVVKDDRLPPDQHRSQMKVDSKPGLSIYTTYMKQEVLFDALFLGDITTEDAIDEHTAVIRALFHDPDYTAAIPQILISLDPARIPEIQQALLMVARRYERPWFEKLQRRRMIQYYTDRGWSVEDAETHLNRQLAELPEGQGIEVLVENLMQEEMSFEEFIA